MTIALDLRGKYFNTVLLTIYRNFLYNPDVLVLLILKLIKNHSTFLFFVLPIITVVNFAAK